jgi:hypothetical protein
MKHYSYGPVTKERVKRLLEALLRFVNGKSEESSCKFDIEFKWGEEDTKPQLTIQTTLRTLELLTQKDQYNGKLTTGQIQQAIDLLKNFLGICCKNNRIKTKGSSERYLILTMWSKDTQTNLERFEQEWENQKTKKSKKSQDNSKANSNNIFTKSSTSLLSQYIRVKDFEEIKEKTENFVGRDFIFDSINEIIKNPDFPSGYIVIRGEPGIGKSSIIAKLIKDKGYIHHFNIKLTAIRSHQVFLGNICAQLILKYGLNYTTLPPQATEDSGFLSRILAEVAADQKKQKPVVILVDAIDEAEDISSSPGANRLLLPPYLPAGIFFIVTSREENTYNLNVDRRKDIYLEDKDEKNIEDIRKYIHNFLEKNREKMSSKENMSSKILGVQEPEFINVMVEKSEGNFMYLVYVLNDIKEGKITDSNIDNIQHLPKGLKEYYEWHWKKMKIQNKKRFEKYYEPVVCKLALAKEPVSVKLLAEWTKLDSMRVKEVIREWRSFLNESFGENEYLYRIYHASFQSFLEVEVGLVQWQDYQEDIAKVCMID